MAIIKQISKGKLIILANFRTKKCCAFTNCSDIMTYMRQSHLTGSTTWYQDRIHDYITCHIHCILKISFNLQWRRKMSLANVKSCFTINPKHVKCWSIIEFNKHTYACMLTAAFLMNKSSLTSCKISLLGPLNKIVQALGFLHSVMKQKYLKEKQKYMHVYQK